MFYILWNRLCIRINVNFKNKSIGSQYNAATVCIKIVLFLKLSYIIFFSIVWIILFRNDLKTMIILHCNTTADVGVCSDWKETLSFMIRVWVIHSVCSIMNIYHINSTRKSRLKFRGLCAQISDPIDLLFYLTVFLSF